MTPLAAIHQTICPSAAEAVILGKKHENLASAYSIDGILHINGCADGGQMANASAESRLLRAMWLKAYARSIVQASYKSSKSG